MAEFAKFEKSRLIFGSQKLRHSEWSCWRDYEPYSIGALTAHIIIRITPEMLAYDNEMRLFTWGLKWTQGD